MTESQSSRLVAVKACRECGGTSLTWDTHYKSDAMVPEGRLRTNELKCLFVLGCDDCSETLVVVSAETVAAHLTANTLGTLPGTN